MLEKKIRKLLKRGSFVRSFVVLGVFFPALIFAQQATPTTLQELSRLQKKYDALVAEEKSELQRNNQILRDKQRVEQSSANDFLAQERKRLIADVVLSPLDNATYLKNFELAKNNFSLGGGCGTKNQRNDILAAAAQQLMSDPDVRMGFPFKGGIIIIDCVINEKIGMSGATKFSYPNGKASNYRMLVKGPFLRIFYSIIPHEISHVLAANKLNRPLPRCLEEGLCQMAEERSEQLRQYLLLQESIKSSRGKKADDLPIPFFESLLMMEYPDNKQDNWNVYTQGAALTNFIALSLERGFDKKLDSGEAQRLMLNIMNDAHELGWNAAVKAGWEDNIVGRKMWDFSKYDYPHWSTARKAIWVAAYKLGWNAVLRKYSDMLDVHSPDISSVDNLSDALKAWIKNGYVLPNTVIHTGGTSRP